MGPFRSLQSEKAHIIASYERPQPLWVVTDGNIELSFTAGNDSNMRIKSWIFTVANSCEYLERQFVASQGQPSEQCMPFGLPGPVIEFLGVCVLWMFFFLFLFTLPNLDGRYHGKHARVDDYS